MTLVAIHQSRSSRAGMRQFPVGRMYAQRPCNAAVALIAAALCMACRTTLFTCPGDIRVTLQPVTAVIIPAVTTFGNKLAQAGTGQQSPIFAGRVAGITAVLHQGLVAFFTSLGHGQ